MATHVYLFMPWSTSAPPWDQVLLLLGSAPCWPVVFGRFNLELLLRFNGLTEPHK